MAEKLEWKHDGSLPDDVTNYAHAWYAFEGQFLQGLFDFDNRAILSIGRGSLPAGIGKKNAEKFAGVEVPMPVGSSKGSPPTDACLAITAAELPDVEDHIVIIGILDTGIALGHRRFRDQDGDTRFLASWQQSAVYTGKQPDLPCGREVYAKEINDALKRHSGGDMKGYLDEDSFNRELELTDVVRPLGNRDLELSAAHGTHILDLATGLDPEFAKPEDMRRQRIVAVNLPAQYSHGSAGNFLAYFAVYAAERILHIADALWHKKHPKPDSNVVMGYPIVINFSYGMQAGPKDGSHIFEQALERIIEERKRKAEKNWKKASEVRIVMPAGNDNLMRNAASSVLGEEGKASPTIGYKATENLVLPWRIKPADATANFLEIWTEAKEPEIFRNILEEMEIFVKPPGFPEAKLASLADGSVQVLGSIGFARSYVQHLDAYAPRTQKQKDENAKRKKGTRINVLIATAATSNDLAGAPIAPAGQWKIRIVHKGEPVDVTLYIQSDQSAVVVSRTGLRSYFDHENYRTVLENGALADNYTIDLNAADNRDFENHDAWPHFGPVQRKGTQNAISSLEQNELVVIGGYNSEDGYPAPYSSSTDGDRQDTPGRIINTVSYPSDNGVQFGLLAAGSRDGSVKPFRGTSMATALATRDIAAAFLRDGSSSDTGTETWLRGESDKFKSDIGDGKLKDRWNEPTTWPLLPRFEGKLKMGVGWMPAPDVSRRVTRQGQD